MEKKLRDIYAKIRKLDNSIKEFEKEIKYHEKNNIHHHELCNWKIELFELKDSKKYYEGLLEMYGEKKENIIKEGEK